MKAPQNLRVFGSRSIYQNFLPPKGELFSSCEFILADPAKAQQFFDEDCGENSITIVINPFEYSRQSVELLTGEVWLWFLRRVAEPELEVFGFPDRLGQQAREILESRQHFVRAIQMKQNWKVVVSDAASRDFCETLGVRAVLSPPPVRADARQHLAATRSHKADFLVFTDSSDYGRPFRAAISQWMRSGRARSQMDTGALLLATHSVVIGESVLPDFPYEVAISLALGKTVIAGALNPLWGLEPGIDLVEFSTPEELFHLLEMTSRFPQRTHLMARRGKMKAALFSSDLIFSRLMAGELDY